jgi:hypothetical protein
MRAEIQRIERETRAQLRSMRPSVRNPVLALPAAQDLAKFMAGQPSARARFRAMYQQLAKQARANADKCWRTHKAPMAAYWKACAVYARHIALVLR